MEEKLSPAERGISQISTAQERWKRAKTQLLELQRRKKGGISESERPGFEKEVDQARQFVEEIRPEVTKVDGFLKKLTSEQRYEVGTRVHAFRNRAKKYKNKNIDKPVHEMTFAEKQAYLEQLDTIIANPVDKTAKQTAELRRTNLMMELSAQHPTARGYNSMLDLAKSTLEQPSLNRTEKYILSGRIAKGFGGKLELMEQAGGIKGEDFPDFDKMTEEEKEAAKELAKKLGRWTKDRSTAFTGKVNAETNETVPGYLGAIAQDEKARKASWLVEACAAARPDQDGILDPNNYTGDRALQVQEWHNLYAGIYGGGLKEGSKDFEKAKNRMKYLEKQNPAIRDMAEIRWAERELEADPNIRGSDPKFAKHLLAASWVSTMRPKRREVTMPEFSTILTNSIIDGKGDLSKTLIPGWSLEKFNPSTMSDKQTLQLMSEASRESQENRVKISQMKHKSRKRTEIS